MLRRPSASFAAALASRRGARRTARDTDSPAGSLPTLPAPRSARPHSARPHSARPHSDELGLDVHLARVRAATGPVRAGAIDDDAARSDPPTRPFAALSAAVSARDARVATSADRPRTARFAAASTA